VDIQTVIFYGCAGAGKGTQAALLQKHLEERNPERVTLNISTGDKFRAFASGDTYFAQKQVKEILNKGGLMPAFLPIWLWSGTFVEQLTGNEHLIVDGFPRRPEEAVVFDSAIDFFGRQHPMVVSLNVPAETVMQRLLEGRKRGDDKEEEIKSRLAWYEKEVVPTIQFFRDSPRYQVFDVEGTASIEEVHAAIKTKLQLS
jgi:adenylate kinase family enzyme